MADLHVILKTMLVGPGVSYVPGDNYPVISLTQGDLMVARNMAAWPIPEKPPKKPAEKPAESAIESDTTVTSDDNKSK